MQITFQCPNCRQAMSADSQYSGQQVRCPGCGQGVIVPSGNAYAGGVGGGVACPHCGNTLALQPELAGRQVQCPHCGNALVMPGVASAGLSGYGPAGAAMPNGFPGQSGFAEAQKFYGARSQQLASQVDMQWIVMVLVVAMLAVAGGFWYFHEPRANDEGPLWKPFGSRLWKSETPIQYFCFETEKSVEARKGKPWRRRYYTWVIMNSTSEKLQVEVQYKDSDGGKHRDQPTLYPGTVDYDAPMLYDDVKGKLKVSVLGGPVLTQRPKNVKTRQFAIEKLKTFLRDLKNALR